MSSFYDDASLVVIPSGYKTSKIYAEKPTDGSGDLTFTRASGATRVGPNGLIEEVRTNLVLQSNTFSTTWTNVSSTETSGQAGYDGTNNAWLLDKSAAQGHIAQSPASSGLETFSVYAKAGTDNWLHFLIRDSASTFFGGYYDLQNGVVGSATGATTLSIQSVGNGWYRCSASFTKSNTSYYRIYPAEGNNDTSGTSGNILIQNAQLETGDIATNYIPTTTAAVSVGPVSNVPRLDYLGSSCPRLLLEPQRTNLFTFSESFDDSSWNKAGSTITANNATSPDGYSSADRIVETATTATHLVLRSVALTAASHTFSCFIKAVSGSTRNVGLLFNTTGKGVIVNPSTGAVVLYSGTTAADVKIETYSNGWYRVAVTATTAAITESLRIYLANGTTWTSPYAGDGTSSALIWGAQIEAGAYATSYVPTTSASVTRVADAASKTGISSLIGQTEGTIFGEAFFQSGQENLPMWVRNSSGGLFGDYILMYTSPSGFPAAQCQVGGVNQVNIVGSSPISTGWHKYAFAYKQNDFAFYVDGVFIGSDSSGSVPTCNEVYIDQYIDGAIRNTSKRQALVFKTRLTNAQLAELTTL